MELEIDAGSGRGEYAVHVVRAPAGGHASGTFTLDVDGILERLPQLEATVLASAVAARRTMPVAEMAVREVGQQLFQALFTREVYGTYRASLGAAQHAGQQLRVVLRLSAPELATMPWETLFDPETETYLCQTEPLLRHIPAPDYNLNPLDVEPPLRILGIVASPRDLPSLDVAAEKEHLARALAGPVSEGRVELVWAKTGTWDDVQSLLLAGPWHVVHFVGHGDYDSRTDEGRIALVGPDGRAAMVRAVRLMALLSVAAPRPRLVVLNSCSSGEMGQSDLFSGTASALVRSGIGAVAAMQFAISDYAAIAFAHGFYAAIANGRTVDEAARVGRISVMASPDGTLEWVTPALYVRGGTTQLFTLKGTPRTPAAVEGTAQVGSGASVESSTAASTPAGQAAAPTDAGSTAASTPGGQAAAPADAGSTAANTPGGQAAAPANAGSTASPPDPVKDPRLPTQTAPWASPQVPGSPGQGTQPGANSPQASAGQGHIGQANDGQADTNPVPQPRAAQEQAMKRAQLRALYVQASAELRARRLEQAVELFEDLLTLEPGYRDATTLRDNARQRLELDRTYREALEAEEAEDWLAAADGFAAVQDHPAFPDAASRRQDCERRQRISDLQGELRYHSSLGSWEAVLDVSAELATVDPLAADPDGLATAAREELEKARPTEPSNVEVAGTGMDAVSGERKPEGSYTAADPPVRPARKTAAFTAPSTDPGQARRPLKGSGRTIAPSATGPAPSATAGEVSAPPATTHPATSTSKAEAPAAIPPSNAGVSRGEPSITAAPTPSPSVAVPGDGLTTPRWMPLLWGGVALVVAGGLGACFAVYFLWLDDNYWYESGGDGSLRVVYGLVAPLGYVLLALAGLPDRTAAGRVAMVGVVVSGAVFGLSGLNETVDATAVVASFVHAGLGAWAGILALRSRTSTPFGWLLMWPTVTVPLVWVQDKGVFLESWYRTHAYFVLIQLVVVCAAGVGLVVAARRLAAAEKGQEHEQVG
ncbi:CHAT domain-containing protein [Arthrobacter sp. StoSoilB20]|uniref:CHAT domain-containing protein n=1 Tax=Arthrobacter sp. StoSoilB20 TaxID=2830995 RepID=UPI001CC72020|nr:CHAT domain-containing protein [Arthrobacter sp. StoSoilB20]